MSSPIQPSGTSTPSSSRTSVSAENSRPATRSVGSSSLSLSSARFAGSTPSSSHFESPTSWPWAAKNGKHMAPPISTESARSRNASRTPILSVTLAPPTTATSGRLRVLEDAGERRDLALQQPPRRRRQQVRDRLGGGVRAVRGAERVVDVDVGERRVALGQRLVVLGLPRLVADVLDHHDVNVRDLVEVGRERHLGRRAARTAARRPASARTPARGPSGARGGRAARASRRPSRAAPSSVGSAALMRASSVMRSVVQGDIEVHPDQDALPLDVEIVKRAHAPARAARARRSGSSSPTRCRTRRRP